jgi:tetratricopeptide (TPR) repeat protein
MLMSELLHNTAPFPWWYAYGPFPAGEHNMPHAGKVITFYRELKGWSVAHLGAAIGVKERQMYNIEGSATVPEPLSRRELLTRLLNIPPALLGVLALDYLPEQQVILPEAGRAIALPPSTIEAYEGVLVLAWESYYTSSAQRSASTVALWLAHLKDSLGTVSGVAQDQLRALLCRFYQLSGVIARDRVDFALALAHGNEALALALHLRNAELVASALYRRARTYVEMHEYDLAIADLERALPYAGRSRDPLRCYTNICLAEAYSLAAPADLSLQKKSLNLLDEVGRTVRAHGVLSGDGSFVKVDAPGLYMVRGDVLRRFGRLEDAQDALLIVRDHLPKNFTRWQGNLLVSEAELCYADRDIAGACDLALDALDLLDETRSSSTRAKIEGLYERLTVAAPRHSDVKRLEQRLFQPPVREGW